MLIICLALTNSDCNLLRAVAELVYKCWIAEWEGFWMPEQPNCGTEQ